jgi:CheY-like chemotaxis protein
MNKCDILIIDDDNDDIEILSDAFTSSGVNCVHYEESATKAIAYLNAVTQKDDLPKLIITDFYLNGITGADLIHSLKKIEDYKHIPVIVLSTQRSEKEIDKYRQMGAADYLVKPSSYKDYLKLAVSLKDRLENKEW